MSNRDPFDYGFGTVWQHVYVNERQGYHTSVADYHRHDFYEINLILSGNVKILLRDCAKEGRENRMVLTRPGTPHYISCKPDTLYHRLYLVFTDEFVANYLPEWSQLCTVFGEKGSILTLSAEQTERFRALIRSIQHESSLFRQRLLIYELLSHISELTEESNPGASKIPPYIIEALAYLDEHYAEKIVAAELARRLHIGRTTLMTEFKRHLGSTVTEYLTHCRLRHAIRLLQEGRTREDVAEKCGFADNSGLVRAFKRCYGSTPRAYLNRKEP
ncbi:MAG: helix-turn-helix transcriptional regulator [Clostridia bacterium]|nr:helix-turn-helix transcriptional regulator [Clostridia bacterium]